MFNFFSRFGVKGLCWEGNSFVLFLISLDGINVVIFFFFWGFLNKFLFEYVLFIYLLLLFIFFVIFGKNILLLLFWDFLGFLLLFIKLWFDFVFFDFRNLWIWFILNWLIWILWWVRLKFWFFDLFGLVFVFFCENEVIFGSLGLFIGFLFVMNE